MTAFSRPAAFPLPLLTVPDPPWSRSRRSQQRAALLRQTVETTNTVSSALNSLCPPEVSVLEPASNSVSALQSRLSAAVFTAGFVASLLRCATAAAGWRSRTSPTICPLPLNFPTPRRRNPARYQSSHPKSPCLRRLALLTSCLPCPLMSQRTTETSPPLSQHQPATSLLSFLLAD
jgi:hypothetical protein